MNKAQQLLLELNSDKLQVAGWFKGSKSLEFWPEFSGWILTSEKQDAQGYSDEVTYEEKKKGGVFATFLVKGNAEPSSFKISVNNNDLENVDDEEGIIEKKGKFKSFSEIKGILSKELKLKRK